MQTGRASVTDECRRLAELLRLDAVGVVTTTAGRRRVAWWAAPGCPPLPARLEDVLEGRSEGWIVTPLDDTSSVFARITPQSSIRSPAVLKAIGPSLAAAASEDGPVTATPLPPLVIDEVADEVAEGRGSTRLRDALVVLGDDLGFTNAAMYVPGVGDGWQLAERTGPAQAWDAVLDPGALGADGEPSVHLDARTVPGVGARLASLGCGSVAMLPLPDGARLVLSSAEPGRNVAWVEQARPYLMLVGAIAGEASETRRAERWDAELSTVQRVSAAVRRTLESPGPTVTDLLGAVREALRADEVFHLLERGGDVEVVASPGGEWPKRIPRELRSAMRGISPDEGMEEGTARQLGVVLGARTSFLAAGFGSDEDTSEVLMAGWRDGPGLSVGPMRLVAQVVAGGRVAVEGRRQAVDTLMLRERTKWAYEIHDGLTQTVTTAVLELEALRQRIERDPSEAIEVLGTTKTEIRKALSELRGLLFNLQQESPTTTGEEPLSKYVNDVVRRWRLPARVSVEGDLSRMPKPMLGVAYVVIREALANAAKHAGAQNVNVWVKASTEELTVEVRDTGRGFTATNGDGPRRHFGIEMMRKRVEEINGTLEIDSRPGKGTRVVARLPVLSEGAER